MSSGRRVTYRSCSLCEANCGLAIETEGERIVSIRGDEEHVMSRGYVCPKALGLRDVQEDRDRLRQPIRRVGDRWQPIGWDDAFELFAERVLSIRGEHGDDALAFYVGNPSGHNYGMLTHLGPLVASLPTRNRYSLQSVDGNPLLLTAFWMYGHPLLWPVPDIDRTDHMVIVGANPLASNGSAMTAPDVGRRLRAIQERGGRVVVIDPRRTDTAKLADEHHFIRPGSDAFLLAAMLRTLFEERLVDLGHLGDAVTGLDEVERAVAPFVPERVAAITGIDAATTRRLAREYAAAERAVFYGRIGISLQAAGTVAKWLTQLLNVVTGNVDRPGGIMWPTPAVPREAMMPGGQWGVLRSRVSGKPDCMGEFPVGVLAEEIETEGEGRVRALITIAGNPVLSTPNGRQLDRALAKLDFMVSLDIYRNETTRHAHLILPPTAPLEHDHYSLFFYNLSVRDWLVWSPPALQKPDGALHDWEILSRMTAALARKRGREIEPAATPAEMMAAAIAAGPHPMPWEKVEAAVHGIDLGPLKPRLPGGLATADGKIQCAPPALIAEVARLSERLEDAGGGGFVIIGRRELRSNNSWFHNFPRFRKDGDRCRLVIHPQDAARVGVGDGDAVRVRSRVGEVVVPAELSEDIMRGVVSLPHGHGHGRSGVALREAARMPGASLNDLTDHAEMDPLATTSVLNGVPVELGRA